MMAFGTLRRFKVRAELVLLPSTRRLWGRRRALERRVSRHPPRSFPSQNSSPCSPLPPLPFAGHWLLPSIPSRLGWRWCWRRDCCCQPPLPPQIHRARSRGARSSTPHPQPALNRSRTGFGQHGSEEWGQSGGFPAGSPSGPGPCPGEYAAGKRDSSARLGSELGRGVGGTLQKADQTVPSASHPFLDLPPEAARAGVGVPEAGIEARAGLRGKLPGGGCTTCWGCWSTPPGTSQTMLLRGQVWGPS